MTDEQKPHGPTLQEVNRTIADHYGHGWQAGRSGCQCMCHQYPEHGKLQDALEALKWHQEEIAKIKLDRDALLERGAYLEAEVSKWVVKALGQPGDSAAVDPVAQIGTEGATRDKGFSS